MKAKHLLTFFVIVLTALALLQSCNKKPATEPGATPTTPTTPQGRNVAVLCRDNTNGLFHLIVYENTSTPPASPCGPGTLIGWIAFDKKTGENPNPGPGERFLDEKAYEAAIAEPAPPDSGEIKMDNRVRCSCIVKGTTITVMCPMNCNSCCRLVKDIIDPAKH